MIGTFLAVLEALISFFMKELILLVVIRISEYMLLFCTGIQDLSCCRVLVEINGAINGRCPANNWRWSSLHKF